MNPGIAKATMRSLSRRGLPPSSREGLHYAGRTHLWAFEHKQLGVQNIDGFVVLIQHRAANSDHGLFRFGSRWGDVHDFAFDTQNIARARRPRPSDLAAQTDNAVRERKAPTDEQVHGDSGCVPAARR